MSDKERILYELEALKPFNSVFYDMVKILSENKSLFDKKINLLNLVKNFKNIKSYGLRDCKFFFDILIYVEIYKYVDDTSNLKNFILDKDIIIKDINIKWIEKSIKTGQSYKHFTRTEKIKSFLED
jgi:hypothetical protein